MRCSEFEELSDSYLSGELAVETNHDVLSHLESCPGCRQLLGERREIRHLTRSAIRGSDEFAADPLFVRRVVARLRASADSRKSRADWRVAGFSFAALALVAAIGLFTVIGIRSDVGFRSYFDEMSHRAIGDHVHCGLDHRHDWETGDHAAAAEKSDFVKPLLADGAEVLEVHDCQFENTTFRHYVLKRGETIVSVQRLPSRSVAADSLDRPIISESDSGYQIGSFQYREDIVFVVSDLPESENLKLARTLSNSL